MIPGIIAIALASWAEKEIADSHGRLIGQGFVLAGKTLGMVSLILGVIALRLFVNALR